MPRFQWISASFLHCLLSSRVLQPSLMEFCSLSLSSPCWLHGQSAISRLWAAQISQLLRWSTDSFVHWKIENNDLRPEWIVRYSQFIKSRGVLEDKRYIIPIWKFSFLLFLLQINLLFDSKVKIMWWFHSAGLFRSLRTYQKK